MADKQTWDGAFETIFGYPLREETNGAWWEERIHPEDRERVLTVIDDVLQGMGGRGRTSTASNALMAPMRRSSTRPTWCATQKMTGEVIGSMMDVTERRQAEEPADLEAELRALFAAMTDVILVLDIEGRYVKIAPTNPSLLYKPPDELIGKRCTRSCRASRPTFS